MEEALKKRPVSLIILSVLFIIIGITTFLAALNSMNVLVAKEQQVKIMEDHLAQAERTQDFKPSELQKQFVEAFKNYNVSIVDYVFQFIAILSHFGLLLLAFAILTTQKWTVVYLNCYLIVCLFTQVAEKILYIFLKPFPHPAYIMLSTTQKIILLTIQNIIPLVLILSFLFWYFNRQKIKDFFANGVKLG